METNNLRRLQETELELLLEFGRVCEKLGLRYYLTAGTLLGAVRHKGFIPWDDDIDVAMPREDYDRLARCGEQSFPAGYVYQEYRTEPKYPFYFAKLRKRGTRVEEPALAGIDIEQGIYIDIFPLDWCRKGSRTAELCFKGIKLIDCALLSKGNPNFLFGYDKKYRFLWKALRPLPSRRLFALREELRKLTGCGGRALCTLGGRHGFQKESYDAEWFGKTVYGEFEGERFPAPAGWDALLQNMYGDYMKLPPKEERGGHFIP